MKRGKQESVKTYISTLTVNFGNNQPTKTKSHSESNSPIPKRDNLHSTGAHHKDASSRYRQTQKSSAGTYFQLTTKSSSRREEYKNQDPHKAVTSFQKSKAYFEELNTNEGSTSNSFSSQDEQTQEQKTFSSSESEIQQISPQLFEEPEVQICEFEPQEVSISVSQVQSLNSPDPPSHSSKIPSTSAIRESTASTVSENIMLTTTSTTTTTIAEEKQSLSYGTSEVKSTKPATDYGETDWYMDILLRMQSLEMKQQNLHVQYDFLGKLAQENREDLKQSRDWARYDADSFSQVEVY